MIRKILKWLFNRKNETKSKIEPVFVPTPLHTTDTREIVKVITPEDIQQVVLNAKPRTETKYGTPMLILPVNSIKAVNYFLIHNKDIIYPFILKQLRIAIQKEWNVLELFRIGDSYYIARIEQNEFEKILLDLQQYFISKELYENAGECDFLLKKHAVNMLMGLPQTSN